MRKLFGLFCLILFFVACANKTQKKPDELITIDVLSAYETIKDLKLSEFFEEVEFIPLESSVDSWFSGAYNYEVGNKYIMITDGNNSQIKLFDLEGKFVRSIGKRGKGPGEMVEVRKATMGPQEKFVFVHDARQRKIVKYAVDGSFVKEVDVAALTPAHYIKGMIFINDHEFVIAPYRPYQPMEGFASLPVINNELIHTRDILPRPNDKNLRINVEPHSFLLETPNGITFWEPFVDTMYTISDKGKAIPTHVVGFSQGGPDRNFIETNINPNLYSENAVVTALNDGKFIHLFGRKNYEWFTALYNNETEELFETGSGPECNLTDFVRTYGYRNDLFGANRTIVRQYSKKADRYLDLINLETFLDYYDLDCLRKQEVKFPELRDRFIELVENPESKYQKLIVLMKAK